MTIPLEYCCLTHPYIVFCKHSSRVASILASTDFRWPRVCYQEILQHGLGIRAQPRIADGFADIDSTFVTQIKNGIIVQGFKLWSCK